MINLADKAAARNRIEYTERLIRPYIRRTPAIEISGSDLGLDVARLVLKLELLQHTGSFKPRGAFSSLLTLEVPSAGVVAASGGNHGAAVAFAARTLGKPATVFVPRVTPESKRDRIAGYGARLVISGDSYADALAASEEWAKDGGALQIHAYDQLETIVGQATVALEFEQQAPDLDTLLVAVGGGGLIGGIAAWYAGRIRLIGVEQEAAPTLENALRAGRPVDTRAGGIAADSLGGGRVGDLMFPLAQAYVDRVALVSDEDILDSQRRLWDALRITAEPGGAAALASLLSGKYRPERDERVGVLVCGGNTASPKTPEKVG
jgi:threonine dehydratase